VWVSRQAKKNTTTSTFTAVVVVATATPLSPPMMKRDPRHSGNFMMTGSGKNPILKKSDLDFFF